MKVLVTGSAGFIGMHVCQRLLARGDIVVGVDNLNNHYDPKLKQARLAQITPHAAFRFKLLDIADRTAMANLFECEKFDRVVHLAAQGGVRYSVLNPHAYVDSNLVGFVNVLEGCRHHSVQHLVYASSSSVYGGNTKFPFSEDDPVDHPVSLYAATKRANELMAHSYSHLYGLPTTGVRYFTVYGPWGRPDMSPWLFSSAILEGRPIDVFNMGRMQRDFTYIDDIAEGTVRLLDLVFYPNFRSASRQLNSLPNNTPHRIFNISSHSPVELLTFIQILEKELGKQVEKNYLPMQPGDVVATYGDVSAINSAIGFEPKTCLTEGVARWIDWYKGFACDFQC